MQYCILSDKQGRKASQRPVPRPGVDEVLIRNECVASNPKDWKGPQFFYSNWSDEVEGNDIAGFIEDVGSSVTAFKKGDRVAAYTKMRTHSDHGAYQQYTLAPSWLVFRVPENVRLEDAATLPLAIMTAAVGLYARLKLPLPSKLISPQDKWIIINGASSSVGSFALQLAKLSGLKVLAVAGSSADYARQLGADEVIDYRKEPDLFARLTKEVKHKQIIEIFDAVATPDSQLQLARALSSNQGGEIGVVLMPVTLPEDVTNVGLEPYVRVATAYGENRDFAHKWYTTFGEWLSDGTLKPNRVRLMPHGLDSVDEGLKLLEQGKVSGEKLVYRIADTPSLK